MTCPEFLEVIEKYPDPDLAPKNVYNDANGHMADCPRCFRALASGVAWGLLTEAYSDEDAKDAVRILKAFIHEQTLRN